MHGIIVANILMIAASVVGMRLNIKPPPMKAYVAGWAALAVALAFVVP